MQPEKKSPRRAARAPSVFVVPGDLHLTDDGQGNFRAALWAVEEINGPIRPDFVQSIGDNAQDARPEQFALFSALRARLHAPSDVLVGDHDVHGDPPSGRVPAARRRDPRSAPAPRRPVPRRSEFMVDPTGR